MTPKAEIAALVERLLATKPHCNFGSTLCARDAHNAGKLLAVLSAANPVPVDASGALGSLWRKLKQTRAVGDPHGWDHYAAQMDAALHAAPAAGEKRDAD